MFVTLSCKYVFHVCIVSHVVYFSCLCRFYGNAYFMFISTFSCVFVILLCCVSYLQFIPFRLVYLFNSALNIYLF